VIGSLPSQRLLEKVKNTQIPKKKLNLCDLGLSITQICEKNKSHRLPPNKNIGHRKNLVEKANSNIFSQQRKNTPYTHQINTQNELTYMKSAIYIILLNILHQSNYGNYEGPTM
jgi:hypothetical protein